MLGGTGTAESPTEQRPKQTFKARSARVPRPATTGSEEIVKIGIASVCAVIDQVPGATSANE